MAGVSRRTDGHGDLPVAGERGVQRPGRRQADHGHVVVGSVVALTDHHDPSVVENGQAPPLVVARADGHRGLPVAGERRVQRTGRRQADHGHVLGGGTAGHVGRAGHHHPAIGRHDHGPGQVVAGADGHRGLPVAGERRVERPGRRQADHGHVVVGSVVAAAGHEDVAIGGHGHRVAVVGSGPDGHQYLAVAGERGVQHTGRREARHGHVEVRSVAPVPRDHDLARRADRETGDYVISRSETNRLHPIGREGGVQLSSARQSRYCHIRVRPTKPSYATNDNLSVALQGNRISQIMPRTNIDGLNSIARERGV